MSGIATVYKQKPNALLTFLKAEGWLLIYKALSNIAEDWGFYINKIHIITGSLE